MHIWNFATQNNMILCITCVFDYGFSFVMECFFLHMQTQRHTLCRCSRRCRHYHHHKMYVLIVWVNASKLERVACTTAEIAMQLFVDTCHMVFNASNRHLLCFSMGASRSTKLNAKYTFNLPNAHSSIIMEHNCIQQLCSCFEAKLLWIYPYVYICKSIEN